MESTWRIIPGSKWLITMVIKSPKDRVVPLPNGFFMAYKWWLLTTYKSWDDPPSMGTPCFLFVANLNPKDWDQQHEERSDSSTGGSCGHCVPRFFLVKAAWWNWFEGSIFLMGFFLVIDWLTISQLNIN